MQEQEIVTKIQEKFPEAEIEWQAAENGDNALFVPGNRVDVIVGFLKTDWDLNFDYLMNISALDTKEHLEVTYHLASYKHGHTFNLKVKTPRENAAVNSITDYYGTANFQEREVYDHFGVNFHNHPDMRRILLPDDWDGYPLLKDYEENEEYNGIGTTRPSML